MFATDAHPMAFYAGSKHSRLSRRALRLFEDASEAKTVIYIPTPALWEIHRLITAGRTELPLRFDHWCRDLDSEAGFIIEPLTWHDIDEARHLPFLDPFDCLITGTALRLGIPLITKDQAIVDSGLVETIW